MSALEGRDVWVFDLDNTLYPADHEIFADIGERMTDYIARLVGVDHDMALRLREKYFVEFGATVCGLVKHHGADAADFLHYVHDLPMTSVHPDPALGALIARLPGRRICYTNGARDYAGRILAQLQIADAFDEIFALEDADLVPKPQRGSFERLLQRRHVDPRRAVMFEDHARNLETAHAMGFATVLVGAAEWPGAYVDFATSNLHAFLQSLLDTPPVDAAARLA